MGIAGDLLVLVAPRVGQELDRVLIAFEIGVHRPARSLSPSRVTSIAKPIFFISSQTRSVVAPCGIVVGHVSLHCCWSDNDAVPRCSRAGRCGYLEPRSNSVLLRVLPVSA